MIDGKQIQTTLPQSYGFNEGCLSLAQARAENERIQNLAKIGVDFRDLAKENQEKEKQAQKIRAIEDKTFNDLFETWLADGVSRQDNNVELKRMFNKDVFPFLAKKRVSDITETDIRFILKKIMKDRGTNRIAVRIHKDIIQLFKWAEERQPWRKLLIEGNPAKVVDTRSIILSEYEDIYGISDRLLSDEEILELHNIYIKIITRQINDRQVMFKNCQEDAKSKRNCNNSLVLANGENGD